MELKAQIEQSQRDLVEIQKFQGDYLHRRAARGTRTATDIIMEQHIEKIGRALDLLEAFKAMVEE